MTTNTKQTCLRLLSEFSDADRILADLPCDTAGFVDSAMLPEPILAEWANLPLEARVVAWLFAEELSRVHEARWD